MKFLWLLRREIGSNIFSTLLILAELAFLIIALCICSALSQRVLGAASFFGKYDGRSLIAALGKADKQEIEETLNEAAELAVFVNYYYAQDKSGESIYLGDYSKTAFTELALTYSGDMVDVDKDYGDAVPAMVSRTLSHRYEVGKIYQIKDVSVYICGALENDYLYQMTSGTTNENFFMCYDTKGLLGSLTRSSSSNAFLVFDEGRSLDTYKLGLAQIPLIKGSAEFEWKEKLGEDFDRLSGNLIIGMLVLLITLIGFAANNILTIRKNQAAYRALNYIGQSKLSLTGLFLSRQLLCLCGAAVAIIAFRKKINGFLGEVMITNGSLLMCIGVCLVLILLSVTVVLGSASRRQR